MHEIFVLVNPPELVGDERGGVECLIVPTPFREVLGEFLGE